MSVQNVVPCGIRPAQWAQMPFAHPFPNVGQATARPVDWQYTARISNTCFANANFFPTFICGHFFVSSQKTGVDSITWAETISFFQLFSFNSFFHASLVKQTHCRRSGRSNTQFVVFVFRDVLGKNPTSSRLDFQGNAWFASVCCLQHVEANL